MENLKKSVLGLFFTFGVLAIFNIKPMGSGALWLESIGQNHLAQQEAYEERKNEAISDLRDRFVELKSAYPPISRAVARFYSLGLRGKAMFDAHKMVLNDILSNDEDVIEYINTQKIVLEEMLQGLMAECDDLQFACSYLEISYPYGLDSLKRIALGQFLSEKLGSIALLEFDDDADLMDKFNLGFER